MDTMKLLFSLLVGCAGAASVWYAARAFCRRLAPAADNLTALPEEAGEEDLVALYRQVLARRLAALFLCLLALAAWFLGLGWVICLLPAGAGCAALYSAWRLRTRRVLRLTRQKLGVISAAGE